MRRTSYRPYVFILIALCCLINLSYDTVEKLRSGVIASLAPSWRGIHFLKGALLSVPTLDCGSSSNPQEIQQIPDALAAKVIFREPDSWSSSVWLNKGERDNRALGKTIVANNSPVVIGKSLVGVVEYVSYRQCRVRLITDSNLSPSVRALRGGEQNRRLLVQLQQLLNDLETRSDLFSTSEQFQEAQRTFHYLKTKLSQETADLHLAKGELHGSSTPLWRSRGQVLQGLGFNYDYSDDKGSARDLRTGKLSDGSKSDEPLLKMGDLLVTTGLDGVFPPGLHVATILKIAPLKEGACSYELEAIPTSGDLDDIADVHILPPVDFNKVE